MDAVECVRVGRKSGKEGERLDGEKWAIRMEKKKVYRNDTVGGRSGDKAAEEEAKITEHRTGDIL